MEKLITFQFKNNRYFYNIILFICGIVLVYPLIDTKIIPGHDYIFHVSRILSISAALEEGVFPVRMYVDELQFWGNPVGIFYPSLFIYFPAILKMTGLSVEICYNIFVLVIFYLGLFSSFYGFRLLTKSKFIGFFSAILYISSGYYLLNAYIRSAIGELLALSFMPLAIGCVCAFIERRNLSMKLCCLGIFAITAVIESHVLSSVFLLLASFACTLVLHKKLSSKSIKRLFGIAIIIFCLNASFIIPFLSYYESITPIISLANENFSINGRSFRELIGFFVFWNFFLFAACYIFLVSQIHNRFQHICKYKFRRSFYNYCFLLGVILTILSCSLFPWNDFVYLKNIFPLS